MKLSRIIERRLKLNLRKLILFLAIFSVSILFVISLVISYHIVKTQLINNSLALNAEYANKIAINTDNHLKNILIELEYSAKLLERKYDDEEAREDEVQRLKMQSNYYNSVVISDADGRLINYSPNLLNIDKNKVQSTLGVKNSLKNKKVYVSIPYVSTKNNMIIFISHPIFDKKKYRGFIGAAIYLKEKNIINELLTINKGYKKSYMYVIDNKGQIIFHPDSGRIGEIAKNNSGLEYIKEKKVGKTRLINSRGVDNLAGFSHIKTTDWIIEGAAPVNRHSVISQGHYEHTIKPAETFSAVMDGRNPQLLMDIHTVSEVNDPAIDLSQVNGPATSALYAKTDKKH